LLLQKSSKWWLGDEANKSCSSLFEFCAKKMQRCENASWERMKVFSGWRLQLGVSFNRKNDVCLLFLWYLNQGPWKCGVELVKVYFLSNFQASWHGCMYCTNLGFQTWHKPHFWTISIGQMV
jgi:hypothetical protein